MEAVKNYLTLKAEIKQLASELHDDKAEIKASQRGVGNSSSHPSTLQFNILGKKRDCRHKHIAYSMMRGRTYEQIEAKCREDNKPDFNLIQEIQNAYGTKDVCVGS